MTDGDGVLDGDADEGVGEAAERVGGLLLDDAAEEGLAAGEAVPVDCAARVAAGAAVGVEATRPPGASDGATAGAARPTDGSTAREGDEAPEETDGSSDPEGPVNRDGSTATVWAVGPPDGRSRRTASAPIATAPATSNPISWRFRGPSPRECVATRPVRRGLLTACGGTEGSGTGGGAEPGAGAMTGIGWVSGALSGSYADADAGDGSAGEKPGEKVGWRRSGPAVSARTRSGPSLSGRDVDGASRSCLAHAGLPSPVVRRSDGGQ